MTSFEKRRFEPHAHTCYSNLKLLDSINRPKDLINYALELGLAGIALTEHDCLSGSIEVNKIAQELQKEHPDFKVAIGNEIYLCKDRSLGQKYYHFILIAKNKEGHRALRELSSRAWMNSYWDRGLERVVTTYDDLRKTVVKYPGSLVATSACLGGEASSATLNLINAENIKDEVTAAEEHNHIVDFILFCKELFGEDFYIECAPGMSRDQQLVNARLRSIAKAFGLKMIIGSDAHFLKKEDRFVHKAYLNSQGGEREVDDFYEYAYLQNNEEIREHLPIFEQEFIDEMYANSIEIYNKIENYSLLHKQTIPKVEVKDYPKKENKDLNSYPTLKDLTQSDDKVERYWINQCYNKLNELGLKNKTYLDRLEEEARVKKIIGQKLETNMFSYPVTLQHYVDLFWDCGSIVGAGRGSSCSGLNHYLLGITQLDPLVWDFPFWRYLNEERTELGDIDLDLCPSKRPLILKKIKEERGKNFNPDIDELSRANLGCTMIATFGTEGTRSAILTACRGYRSEEFPDGIDVDTAQYLSSLVPSERGFLWPLKDVVYGNPDAGRKANSMFLNEVNQYPGLLDIMFGIEGLIKQRGSHASGVILFDEDPYEFGCFMKRPDGEIITQYDLHSAEEAGLTKYDFLVTDVSDKITEAIRLLQENGEIESELTLKEIYNKYFHPSVLPIEDDNIWKSLENGSILNLFQFDSDVGAQAAKKIKPHSILEMSNANGLLRLMAPEPGAETPMDKYVRFKNNINLWYQEMDNYGLTKEEQEILKPYYIKSHGTPISQEELMKILMEPKICNFTLAEANSARKTIGKKLMSKIPELHQKVLDQAATPSLGKYVWDTAVAPQVGYSFSQIHATAYSFIGFQTMYIATHWNPIYWNTACLIVNSGALETDIEEDIDKKERGTDYKKLSTALGAIKSAGIKVSLIDINKSGFGFEPDVDNNRIMFGLKALGGINSDTIEKIVTGRPYISFKDFLTRCPIDKTGMISLIKAGAFDNLEVGWAKELNVEPRYLIMTYYLYLKSEPKKKLTLQNFNGLLEKNLFPDELQEQKEVFIFNKFLKANCKYKTYYVFDDECIEFYSQKYDTNKLQIIDGKTLIVQKDWDKIYQDKMDTARDWLKEHQTETLRALNKILFKEQWDKYAEGNLSSWEMSSLCFYYHEHELAHVNTTKYGITDFNILNPDPAVDYFFKRNGHEIPIYKTFKIIGTVISKNDNKSTVDLLTTSGVVTVKFTKDYYAMYNRQISERQEDGSKKIVEKGWFIRGTKLMITGFRRDDMFVAKKYSKTPTHELYKIELKNNGKDMELIHDRYATEDN